MTPSPVHSVAFSRLKSLFRVRVVLFALVVLVSTLLATPSSAFAPYSPPTTKQQQYASSRLINAPSRPARLGTTCSMAAKDDDDKFSFGQRIESTKCVVVGALSGGFSVVLFTALHDIAFGGQEFNNGVAQWEFDTDMGSLESALFAIVYRYCIRKDDNPMLNQGVIGAFVLVRTLSRIRVPSYCTAVPLDCKLMVMLVATSLLHCGVLLLLIRKRTFSFIHTWYYIGGSPLGYFDWSMIKQGVFSGVESVALFGGAALAMEYCFRKGYISKFPG
jgi:hypothetical protein